MNILHFILVRRGQGARRWGLVAHKTNSYHHPNALRIEASQNGGDPPVPANEFLWNAHIDAIRISNVKRSFALA